MCFLAAYVSPSSLICFSSPLHPGLLIFPTLLSEVVIPRDSSASLAEHSSLVSGSLSNEGFAPSVVLVWAGDAALGEDEVPRNRRLTLNFLLILLTCRPQGSQAPRRLGLAVSSLFWL